MSDLVLRTVTGTIKKADGSPWTGATLRFVPFVVVNVDGITVPVEPVTVITDATTAEFAADLLTLADSFLRYFVDLPSGEKYQFDLPDGVTSIDLAALLTVEGLTEDLDSNSAALASLIDAHASVKASSSQLGHVQVDDDSIVIDDGGVISVGVRPDDDFALEFLPEQDLDPDGPGLYLSKNATFGAMFQPNAELGDCWWEFQFIAYPTNAQGVICDVSHGGAHPVLLESIGGPTSQFLFGNMYTGSLPLIEVVGKDNFKPNDLHHAVYAVFGNTLYLYLDGVMSGAKTFVGTRTVGGLTADGILYLGASGDHQGFYGKILRARAFEEVGGNGLPFVTPPGAFVPERVFGDVWNNVAAVWNVDLTRPAKKIADTSGGYDGATHSGYRAISTGSQSWAESALPQFKPTPFELATYSGIPEDIPADADIFDDFSDDNRTMFYNYDQTFEVSYPSIASQGRQARRGGYWRGPAVSNGMPIIGILEAHAVPLADNAGDYQSAWMPTPGGSNNYRLELDTGYSGGINVIVRREDDSNYLLAGVQTTQVTFYRVVGGLGGFIAGGAISNPNFTQVVVECIDNDITVTVGSDVIHHTEEDLLFGTNVGFGVAPLQRLKKIAVVELTATDTIPPSAPVLISASPDSHTKITLVWQAASDNVAVTGYETRVDGGSWVDRGNVLTYQYTGLTAETDYDFEVRAYDAIGNHSAASNLVAGTTDPAPPPPIPWASYIAPNWQLNPDNSLEATLTTFVGYTADVVPQFTNIGDFIEFETATSAGLFSMTLSDGFGKTARFTPNGLIQGSTTGNQFGPAWDDGDVLRLEKISATQLQVSVNGLGTVAVVETFSGAVSAEIGALTQDNMKMLAPVTNIVF